MVSLNPTNSAAISALPAFSGKSGTELANAISDWVISHFTYNMDTDLSADEYVERMLNGENVRGVCHHYADVMLCICRTLGLRVRNVKGYAVEGRQLGRHQWLQVRVDGGVWRSYDPTWYRANLPGINGAMDHMAEF